MHRCKVAHDLLSQIVAEQRADIVIISEQYGRRDQGSWLEDPTKTAAIWIPYRNGISPVKSGSGDGYVWVQLNHFTLFSCYLTPSDSIDAYEAKLDEIEDTMRGLDGHHVVAGDFNSRAVEWGMPTTNPRGRRVLDMAARTGLLVVNTGDVPTFRRPGCEGTIPDITLASEEIIGKITEWSVLETYTASDHQYIMFSFNTGGNTVNEERSTSTRKWNPHPPSWQRPSICRPTYPPACSMRKHLCGQNSCFGTAKIFSVYDLPDLVMLIITCAYYSSGNTVQHMIDDNDKILQLALVID
ncbi:uncharacterized protein LOC131996734 [Stomoxys calcitrans]|uniref:uncharacterized protein LOC131996734 n=1 Tax=Stomoxys calcitrans TaxID=35570 RepID=UPI0027E2FAAD|nr:uncharacterized protein LOC131996734 [Stomoxys calcitrans]